MSNRAELLKSIIKGTNDITEDASLDKYLLSRGINPKFATKDQKVAHSKTGQFIKWKRDHMKDLGESVDKKDTITFDIPLLIRVLEFTREDLKSDINLHKMVERLLNIRGKGTLTMNEYGKIVKEEVAEEEVQQIVMEISTTGYYKAAAKSRMDAAVKVASSMGKDKEAKTKLDARNRGMKRAENRTHAEMKKANSGPQKPSAPQTSSMSSPQAYYASKKPGQYVGDSVEHENATMVEAQSAALRWHKALQNAKKKREEEERRNKENAERALAPKKPVQEADCGCSDVPPQDKNKKLIQMSKSARIIKSIYKKQGVAEALTEMDKSAPQPGRDGKVSHSTYGSRDKQSNAGGKEHTAKAVTAKQATKDALDILKKQGVSEETLDETWKYHQYASKEAASAAREAHHSWRDESGKSSGNPARLVTGNRVAYKGEFKGPKPVKEDMYDHEKEDKSVATYGKKPKVTAPNPNKSMGENKPDAAAILTGGTTLTGQPRDTVEIDPMMRKRPGPDVPGKKQVR